MEQPNLTLVLFHEEGRWTHGEKIENELLDLKKFRSTAPRLYLLDEGTFCILKRILKRQTGIQKSWSQSLQNCILNFVTVVYPQTWNAIPVWKAFIVTKCILNSFFVTRRILVWLDQEIRKSQDHIRYQNVSSKVRFDLGIQKNYVMVNRTKAISTWRGYISYPQAYPQAPDWDTK